MGSDPSILKDRRLRAIVGEALPDDPAQAAQLLKAQTRRLHDHRRLAERKGEQLPGVMRAIERTEEERRLRTSPALRSLQERGEELRSRLHRARHRSDEVMLLLSMFKESVADRADPAASEGAPGEAAEAPDDVDVTKLPGVRHMLELIEEHKRLRGRTDRVRREGDEIDLTEHEEQ